MKRKKDELELALQGYVNLHQRLMIKTILTHIDFLSEQIEVLKKQFPSAAHLCSWAGLVPGHNESAGKRKSTKTKNGNKYLESALVEAAHSIAASKKHLGAMYRRTAARKGRKRAAINVAHTMLRIAFYLLTRKEMYVDLGEDYYDKQKQQSTVKYSVRRLENLGYSVSISEVS